MLPRNRQPILIVLLSVVLVCLLSCQTVDLYEKHVPIPGHAWKKSFKPSFSFEIRDSASPYNIYVVLRHNERYNYNNIWVALSTKLPGDSAIRKAQYELPLANNEGWIGKESAMDDLYEHRICITPKEGITLKNGTYAFTIEHIMREDPLQNVMNVGLRIEKTITPR